MLRLSICQARCQCGHSGIFACHKVTQLMKKQDKILFVVKLKAMETRGKRLRCYSAKSCTILCPQNRFLQKAAQWAQPSFASLLLYFTVCSLLVVLCYVVLLFVWHLKKRTGHLGCKTKPTVNFVYGMTSHSLCPFLVSNVDTRCICDKDRGQR